MYILNNLKKKGKKTGKNLFFPKQWKSFPKVGKSPSQITPDHSSPDLSPREVIESEIKNEQAKNSFKMSENNRNKSKISKNKEFSSNQTEEKNLLNENQTNGSIEKNKKFQQNALIDLNSIEKKFKDGLNLHLSVGTSSRSALPLKTYERNSACKRIKAIKPVDDFYKHKKYPKKNKMEVEVDKIKSNKSIIRPIESTRNESISLDSISEKYIEINQKNINFQFKKNFKQEKNSLEKNQNSLNFCYISLDECSKNGISSSDNRLNIFKNRTQDLFSHIYLNSNLPKRVSSGIYQINNKYDENNLNQTTSNENTSSPTEIDEYEEINIPYFKSWLKNYKFKKSSLNYRMTQAKLNRNTFENNRREIILNSIFKENLRSFSAKSDSLISMNSLKNHEKSAKVFSYVNLKTPYFVSQLEMEEILDEVNTKLIIDNNIYLNEKISTSYFNENKMNQSLSKKDNNTKNTKMKPKFENKTINSFNMRERKKKYRFDLNNKKNDNFNLKETKSTPIFSQPTSSNPARKSFNETKEYPEIKLQLNIPGSPEKYLLPIRFPKLYKKLISKLKDF